MADAYAILNIPKNASSAEIRKAYQKAALKHHPDRHPPATKASAEVKFKEVGEAYAVLSDVARKRSYDASLNATSNALVRSATPLARQRTSSTARPSTSPPRMAAFSGNVDPYSVFQAAWGKSAAEVFASELGGDWTRQRRLSTSGPARPASRAGGSYVSPPATGGYGAGVARPPSRSGSFTPQPPVRPASRSGNSYGAPQRPSTAMGQRPPVRRDPSVEERNIYAEAYPPRDGTTVEPIPNGFKTTTTKTIFEADGSFHFERVFKERTVDQAGNVHDRFRHTRAGVVMDPDTNGSNGPSYMSGPSPEVLATMASFPPVPPRSGSGSYRPSARAPSPTPSYRPSSTRAPSPAPSYRSPSTTGFTAPPPPYGAPRDRRSSISGSPSPFARARTDGLPAPTPGRRY